MYVLCVLSKPIVSQAELRWLRRGSKSGVDLGGLYPGIPVRWYSWSWPDGVMIRLPIDRAQR